MKVCDECGEQTYCPYCYTCSNCNYQAFQGLQSRIAELEAHLREIRGTAKLVSTTSRMKSVRQGCELSGAPMHYIVPLYLVNGISSLLEASDE